jgi:hypothetical protein
MTNANTNQQHTAVKGYIHPAAKQTDEAPMVITRLSGWIDMGETRTAPPAWIVRTRMNTQSR